MNSPTDPLVQAFIYVQILCNIHDSSLDKKLPIPSGYLPRVSTCGDAKAYSISIIRKNALKYKDFVLSSSAQKIYETLWDFHFNDIEHCVRLISGHGITLQNVSVMLSIIRDRINDGYF
jgi:hypothetical protein